jgi:hypothetical protein
LLTVFDLSALDSHAKEPLIHDIVGSENSGIDEIVLVSSLVSA